MRTVQQTFNHIINCNYYGPDHSAYSRYMCNALIGALDAGFISRDEYHAARNEIDGYLVQLGARQGSNPALEGVLRYAGINAGRYARLGIYLNWANRPLPRGQQHANHG